MQNVVTIKTNYPLSSLIRHKIHKRLIGLRCFINYFFAHILISLVLYILHACNVRTTSYFVRLACHNDCNCPGPFHCTLSQAKLYSPRGIYIKKMHLKTTFRPEYELHSLKIPACMLQLCGYVELERIVAIPITTAISCILMNASEGNPFPSFFVVRSFVLNESLYLREDCNKDY